MFPDDSEERMLLQQRALLLDIDSLLEPDDPGLEQRRADLADDIRQRLQPPVLVGKDNQLDRIRSSYVDNKIALQLENLPVDDATTSFAFWQYVTTMKARYERKTAPTHATEPI